MIKKEEKEIKEHESATEIDSIKKNVEFLFYSEFSLENNHIIFKVHLSRIIFLYFYQFFIKLLIYILNTHSLFYFFLQNIDNTLLAEILFSQCTGYESFTEKYKVRRKLVSW